MRPSTDDRMMRGSNQRRYDENSCYFNFGYWGAGAKAQRQASEALVDRLVARIVNRTGRILDVACCPASNQCSVKRKARFRPARCI